MLCSESYLEVSGEDAKRLGISDNDCVCVRSAQGELTLKAKVSGRYRPGILFIPYHFSNIPVNMLTKAGATRVNLLKET